MITNPPYPEGGLAHQRRCSVMNDFHDHDALVANGGIGWYNSPYHNGMRGAFLFVKPGRYTHKNSYGQSPPNLGIPQYRCDKRTGSLNYGGFVIMTKGNGLPCKKCGTSDWDKIGNCKQCRDERSRLWAIANPEKVKKTRRNWSKSNPDKRREYTRIWRENNREKDRECTRKYYRNNSDRVNERVREWEKNNPGKVAARHARRRTAKTEAGGSYTAAEWKALCKQYNGRCACCGKKKKLEFDHVVPVTKGGSSDISNGQPLCRSCNSRKGTKTTDYRTRPGLKRWKQDRLL